MIRDFLVKSFHGDGSRRSLWWSMTPKSIRTDIICMNHPPRVQRGHVRRPGHSAGRAVRDGYTCLGIGRDCSGWNYDGGLGIRRGCDRRMRSSSLATASIVSSIGRQKRSAASNFPVRTGKSKGPFRAREEGTGQTPPQRVGANHNEHHHERHLQPRDHPPLTELLKPAAEKHLDTG